MLKKLTLSTMLIFYVLGTSLVSAENSVPSSSTLESLKEAGVSVNQLLITGDSAKIDPSVSAYVDEVTPSFEKTYTFFVTNPTDRDITATLYATDVKPALGGGKNFSSPSEEPVLAGSWISPKPRKITVPSGGTQQYEFTAKLPDSLDPGQYIAFISVYDDSQTVKEYNNSEKAFFVTNIENKVGVQIIFNYNLDKAVVDFTASDVIYEDQGQKFFLTYHVENRGSILVKPSGVVIAKRNGLDIFKQEVSFDSVYAKTVAPMRFEFDKPLPPGDYTLTVDLSYEGKSITETLPFSIAEEKAPVQVVNPVDNSKVAVFVDGTVVEHYWFKTNWHFLVIGLLVVLLLFGAYLLKRKKSSSTEN